MNNTLTRRTLLLLIIVTFLFPMGCRNLITTPESMKNKKDDNLLIGADNWKINNTILWKYKKKSNFHAICPSYYDGNIYTIDDGDVVALKATTGQLIWKYPTNGFEGGYPVASNNIVVFGCIDFYIYAIQADTGKLLWKFKTGDIIHSVIVSDDLVFAGGDDRNLYSIDLKTGLLIWKQEMEDRIQLRLYTKDGNLYLGDDHHRFYSFDTLTGKLNWKVVREDSVGGALAIDNNNIFFGSSFRENRAFYSLNVQTGKEQWKFETGGNFYDSPVIYKNNVIFYNQDSFVYSLDAQTGNMVWKKQMNQGFNPTSGPTLDKDTLHIGSYEGQVYAISAEDGSAKWVFDDYEVNEPMRVNLKSIRTKKPLVVGSTIYFENDLGYLYAIQVPEEK